MLRRLLKKCEDHCRHAETILQEQDDPSPIAGWAREIIDFGRQLLAEEALDEQTLADAYVVVYEFADKVYEHPRLLLELRQLAYDMVLRGEAMTGETYKVKDEIKKEIDELKANIQAADEGRFGDIKSGKMLKVDPVEWTAKYEAVIDEADRDAYKRLKDAHRGMGFCFEYWAEKQAALAKRGIEWRSPSAMNPGVMFD